MTEHHTTPGSTPSVQLDTFRHAYHAHPGATVTRMGVRYVASFSVGDRQLIPAARLTEATMFPRDLAGHGLNRSSIHKAAPDVPEAETILDDPERVGAELTVVPCDSGVHGVTLGVRATPEDGRSVVDTLPDLPNPRAVREPHLYWARTSGQNPAALLQRLGGCVLARHPGGGSRTARSTPARPWTPRCP